MVVQSAPMRGKPPEVDPVEDLLESVYARAEDDPDAALALLDAADPELAGEPEILACRGELVWTLQGPEAAQTFFEQAVAADPEFADARYELAEIHGLLGEEDEMIAQFLEVYRLDAIADRRERVGTPSQQRFIAEVAEEVLAGIPDEFRSRLEAVPVVLEARPSKALVATGFDPRALGVFDGDIDYVQRTRGTESVPTVIVPAPTRIVLFYANLLTSFPDEEVLREEIETTILHEIGHFFGLDEDDMERLGLE